MSDFLTVLVSGQPLTKQFRGPTYEKTDYSRQSRFETFEYPVANLRELSAALFELEAMPNACVIRAKLRDGIDPMSVVRRKDDHHDGVEPCFEEFLGGHHWLMIDFDKVPVEDGIQTNEDRLEYLVSMLPPAFHNASYHYQWSASAGFDGWGLLSCHMWFWLKEPWRDGLLIERIKDQNWEVDESTIRTVQPNYTANPVFEDCTDPIEGIRSGLIEKQIDEVTLPPWVRKAVRDLRGRLVPLKRSTSNSFEEKLNDIGPRYHNPINSAIASYVATHKEVDREWLKDRIKQRINEAPPGASPKRVYLNDYYLDASINGALRKFWSR